MFVSASRHAAFILVHITCPANCSHSHLSRAHALCCACTSLNFLAFSWQHLVPVPSGIELSALTVQEGAHLNVVFMDNDIFVFKSLARIFENEDFDYGCTISDSKPMPVRDAARHIVAMTTRSTPPLLSSALA